MTETIDTPRDDAGKFTQNTDNLYGAELANAEAGFKTRPRDPEPEEISGDAESLRELAANRNAAKLPELSLSVTELREAQGGLDTKEAVSLEQAARDLASSRTEISKFADGINFDGLAEEVDQKRAEVVDGDKAKAKHFGFELDDGAKTDVKQEAAPAEDQVDAATAAAIDAVEGLDETTKRALKIPAVRAAIEQQLGEVDTARQQLATERALAQQFAQASFIEGFPELAGLPPQHLEAGLQQLAQQNPQRFQQAMGILGRVQALQASAQQAQAAQAHEQRQQIETWAKAEDARLKSFGVEFTTETANAVAEYAKEELAIDRQQLAQVMLAHPILRSAEFQRVMHDAAQYRRIKAAPKAVPQSLPKVQRPGVQQERPRPEAANISSLQKELASARGNRALQIAAQIKSAQRKARA